jgi:hypothetical protein
VPCQYLKVGSDASNSEQCHTNDLLNHHHLREKKGGLIDEQTLGLMEEIKGRQGEGERGEEGV